MDRRWTTPTWAAPSGKVICSQIEESTSDYDKEKLQKRLAKLVGGVAVINVGASTETEMKERLLRLQRGERGVRAPGVDENLSPPRAGRAARRHRCGK